MLNFLHHDDLELPVGNGTFLLTIDNAVRTGDFELLRALQDRQFGRASKDAMDIAATAGRLDMVQFLDENRSEGGTFAAFTGATAGSHDTVLEYLRTHRPQDELVAPRIKAKDDGDDRASALTHGSANLLDAVATTGSCIIM
ncbi:hypothetical protein ACHHYP_20218 [Achlya hypogyna]|uniref:Uncharacterized protein n=1 Tax=Achlya hypogyna TaxID=1202772 RepID=A0A1V9ZNV1_ACHHY|nr:hypothetical protein ACHHYP_20218 [Achlya hypogyna]